MNDASRLNPTPVRKHARIEGGEATVIKALQAEMAAARAAGAPLAVGAARHSMGGQSLARHGVAVSLDTPVIEPDVANRRYRVLAGTRWRDVIAALDRIGFSPAVMQSNADFGVGATFSVNAHGWPAPFGPFGSTVQGITLMLADGTLMECSRSRNAELFRLAMGGYGLFGVVVSLVLDMVPNVLLRAQADAVSAEAFAGHFMQRITAVPDLNMLYGRLSVSRRRLLRDGVVITFRPVPTPATGLPPPQVLSGARASLYRTIFRAQYGSEVGKEGRWFAETRIGADDRLATRNNLMAQPVSLLAERRQDRTDILHEYFLPPERLAEFLEGCRAAIPKALAEFLNVTLRLVKKDDDSVLSFAPGDRIAAVMSFSQGIGPQSEVDMITLTEHLIDAALKAGGSYYLPYRLHARPDQLRAAYPRFDEFAGRKRHYDPDLLFRNALWERYGRG